jgi:hypothetical protein
LGGGTALHRTLFVLIFTLFGLAATVSPVGAAGQTTRTHHSVNWATRDTAVYVVSTLNLLHTRQGHLVTAVLQHHGVTRFDVYADVDTDGVYFVLLKRESGTTVGGLVYQMGWERPQSLFGVTDRFITIQRANSGVRQEFKSDSKLLIGSFSSTMPM